MRKIAFLLIMVLAISVVGVQPASADGAEWWHYAVGVAASLVGAHFQKDSVAPAAAVTIEACTPGGKPFKPVAARQQLELAFTKGIWLRVKPGITGKFIEWMNFTVDGITFQNQILSDGSLKPVKAPRADRDFWCVVIDTCKGRYRYAHPLEKCWWLDNDSYVWYELPLEVGGMYTLNFISEAGEMVTPSCQISIEDNSFITNLLTDAEYRQMVAAISRTNGQAVYTKVTPDGVVHYFAGSNQAGWKVQQQQEGVINGGSALPPVPAEGVSHPDTSSAPAQPAQSPEEELPPLPDEGNGAGAQPAPPASQPVRQPKTQVSPKQAAQPPAYQPAQPESSVQRPVQPAMPTQALSLSAQISDPTALNCGVITIDQRHPCIKVTVSGNVKAIAVAFTRGEKVVLSNSLPGSTRTINLERSKLSSGAEYHLALFGTNYEMVNGQLVLGQPVTFVVKVQ